MWADPQVTRFIFGQPSTRQQTWQRMLTYMGLWHAIRYGYWAIEEKQTGAYAGDIGFGDFKRDIVPSMQNVPEVGFALVPRFHGLGYATEALRAVLEWGDEHLPSTRTVALANEANAASIRVLEKCGYTIFEHALLIDVPVVFMERRPIGVL
jgi:RimJ/RimL family protein N-acetyltransferase